MNKQGKITQIIGAVVDVILKRSSRNLTALEVTIMEINLILEVAQHLGKSC